VAWVLPDTLEHLLADPGLQVPAHLEEPVEMMPVLRSQPGTQIHCTRAIGVIFFGLPTIIIRSLRPIAEPKRLKLELEPVEFLHAISLCFFQRPRSASAPYTKKKVGDLVQLSEWRRWQDNGEVDGFTIFLLQAATILKIRTGRCNVVGKRVFAPKWVRRTSTSQALYDQDNRNHRSN